MGGGAGRRYPSLLGDDLAKKCRLMGIAESILSEDEGLNPSYGSQEDAILNEVKDLANGIHNQI